MNKYPYLTFFTGIGFLVLIALGSWQLQRLAWKTDILNKIHAGLEKPAIALPADINLSQDELKKVRVSGKFLNDKEIHIGAKYNNGHVGYYILTPLIIDDGREVLVNRGWVPEGKQNISTRTESLKNNKVEIIGLLMRGYPKHWYLPKNNLAKNIWFTTDFSELKKYLGINIEGYIIQELPTASESNKLPIPIEPNIKIRNDHLQYAFTWYSLAIILVIIYFVFLRGEKRKNVLPES